VASDQVIKEHADGGYLLLYRRHRVSMGVNILDDHERVHLRQFNPLGLTPPEESPHCQGVRRSGAAIMDLGGEEFNKPRTRPLARAADRARQTRQTSRDQFVG